MNTRKVSAAVGFALLMACVVVVVTVIYNGGSPRTSYRSSMEESWKKRDISMRGRQEVLGTNSMVIPTTSESSAQEAKKLADELQKLFTSKTTSGGSHKRVSGRVTIVDMAEDKTLQKPVPPPSPPRLHRTENIVPTPSSTSTSSVKPPFEMNSEKTSPIPITPSSPVGSQHSPDDNGRLETQTPATSSLPPVRAEQEDLDYVENDHHYESGMTSINSRNLQKNFHNHPAQPQRSNILLVKSSAPAPPSSPEDSLYRRRPMSSQMAPSQPGERHNHDRRIVRPPPHFIPPSQANNRFGSAASANWEEEQDSESDDDYGPQSQSSYVQDSNNNPRDPLKAMGNMIQLVTDVYKRGRDGLDVAGFLRVINETVQRSNNNNLLSQLNQMYARHGMGNWSAALFPQKSEVVGRNALENSLSAFVFMSFGVFLLNQIHNFMGTSTSGEENTRQGRRLDYTMGDSQLNFLFEPPPAPLETTKFTNISDNVAPTPSHIVTGSSVTTNFDGHENTKTGFLPTLPTPDPGNSSNLANYVNNMFRAGINLVNAYTKDTQALDCIWSKYCQDLDKTAAEHGSLYSIAARINSVGLRLLYGQIPTELTVDVVLRSLLGWDGLPCVKMFTKCNLVHGQLLRETTTEIVMNSSTLSAYGEGLVQKL